MEATQKAMIGKDELCKLYLHYTRVTPLEDNSGCQVEAVYCMDPQGKIPDMLKKKIAGWNSKMTEMMVTYIRKQKGLI